MRRRHAGSVSIWLAVLLIAMLGSVAQADPAADALAKGAYLYEIYCTNCHGKTARGDGPTAAIMEIKPADLTRIAKANGGVFPAERVYDTIDGRDLIRGHGSGRMPIWGLAFQDPGSDADQEADVRQRIELLTGYLESIQVGATVD